MLTWIKMLPIELDEVTEYLDPHTPIGPGEKIIGTATEDLKKLYTLWMSKEKTIEENKIRAKFSKTQDEREEAIMLILKDMEVAECLMRLFWIAIKDEFDLWKTDSMTGIRTGYIVVTSNPRGTSKDLKDLWDLFFGKH